MIPAYWWDGHPNFGDALTPWLLPKYGILPVHRGAPRARLSGIGSVLEFLPRSYDGAIWGSGLMLEQPHPLPDASVLAVRGPLTAELIGAQGPVAFGDPGLLVARHLRRPERRWRVGVVPHGHHRGGAELDELLRKIGPAAQVIDVHQEAAPAVRQIAACEMVVSTSLHGLITADAFGIPAFWTMLTPPLTGGDFKFRDYEAALTPGRTRFVALNEALASADIEAFASAAPYADVNRISDGLERALESLRSSPHGFGNASGASDSREWGGR
ncbi:polysaccharide pyruvyl transferase family protein [Agromyces sp. H66]|uniref:polysaccharide pyruvyl transferase family protein n=1 Tax=Agromyces sp. H66 TaxID=2529859 RepID=UPI00145B119C|nr:polysaccharide pyruvyl transferase family protein [Agromyces sp. H66]